MIEKIENQILVKVHTQFNELNSHIDLDEFFFTYHILITNRSNETVQLISRKWNIIDSNGENRYVEGEGVVGEQPILSPGETYEYYSGCMLKTGFGKMFGFYVFATLPGFNEFEVEVPEFNMVLPWVLN